MQALIDDLSKTLLSGNWFEAEKWLDGVRQKGLSPLHIQEEIIRPAMYKVGVLWEKNQISVADEHLATITADYILTRLQGSPAASAKKPLAMLFCLEGEEHYLGLKMTSTIFKAAGWDVKMLGSNLPIDHAVYFARKWKPEVIGISISISTLLPNLLKCEEKLMKLPHQPLTLIGGRLVSFYNLEEHVNHDTILVSDLFELEDWIKSYSKGKEYMEV
ncbi:cobalamin B12-binding domain-containing protein [Falsibacillus albus]|uniref:Cobalamin-binding protein n=1 Tax=Falsibacillus albus TaxID=2478915 RepID=A0A3L7JXC6_9BACI|nr:cobalamin-dependent protein [Falsibacillus albus]RLQ93092.1 cobalamin-binding protein [Falsibacillus albus]